MTKRAAFLSCLLAAALARAAAEPPLVQAKLFRVRGGLGNVFAKLAGGGEVKIAYFGGSITAAAGWRVKTLGWFRETWPGAKVKEIHAAIGGTGSDLGAFRCHKDVIAHKPDLVFIEFAVNDGGAKPDRIHQTIEGIVRQIWRANPRTDICFVYTYRIGYEKDLRRGLCPRAASADERIAAHYGIPSINVALRIVELERAGKLIFTVPRGQQGPGGKLVFSHDSCHPTGPGHDIYRDVIAATLTEFQKQSKPGPHTLPKPFAPDNWEDARLAAIQPAMLT